MPSLPTLLLILGVCFGVIGAAGFSDPPKDGAYLLFAVGMALAIGGGVLGRRQSQKSGGEMSHASSAAGDLSQRLQAIALRVQALESNMADLKREDFTEEVDDILRGEYFELGNRSEQYVSQLGFTQYARIWDGVASAERLLARAWSVATDGHFDEAREEIPLVRSHLSRAVQAVETV